MTPVAVLAERVHHAVIERLAHHPGRDRLDRGDQRQLVLSWIQDELESEARRRVARGEPPMSPAAEHEVVATVENTVWGLGRLQALLDVADVEDIHITGCDAPLLRMTDGTVRAASSPIAESDAELVRQIQFIAAHHGSTERAFSPAHPFLNMQLPDGSRLAALRDVVARPVVTIRRHRLVDIRLADLVRIGTISADLARFLTMLVQARVSILVTGEPSSGKTTLLRALAREIDRDERFATLETEFELNLHRLPRPHPLLYAAECRGGSTERDPATGRPAGETTLTDLLHQTLRMSVTRVIVGEVRGAEALPMLEAMNAGMPGSMCTLHAGSAAEAFDRLVTAAMRGAGAGWSDRFVTRLAAQGIKYVVHMRRRPGQDRRRFVAEVAEVAPSEDSSRVALNQIFAPDAPDPSVAVLQVLPQDRRTFDEAGLDLSFLTKSGWPR